MNRMWIFWVTLLVFFGTPHGSHAQQFNNSQDFSAGDSPRWVAIGDFNQDSKLDLATANQLSDNVSVLLGNGNGTFQAPQNIPAGDFPNSVATGDLDGDGNLDLAAANLGSDNVSVLLGNGDGTFDPAQNFAAGEGPSSIAIGDLDGDGDLDLAVGNVDGVPDEFGNDVSVLLNNGDGTFPAPVSYPVAGIGPFPIAIGDLNEDGSLDIVVTHHQGEDLSVLFGNGDGTFGPAQIVVVGDFPIWVAIGDLNQDGNLDLAVGMPISDDVSVLLGNGDGTFQAPQNYAAGGPPSSVGIGDFDGDGNLDLTASIGSDDNVSLLPGNGDGTFQAPESFAVGDRPNSIAIGDLNGDGNLDLATANVISNDVSVLLGSGDGTFDPVQNFPAGAGPSSIAIGDLDGDGDLDIAVGNVDAVPDEFGNDVSVLLNNGDGTFPAPVSYPAAGIGPFPIAIGDLNGDGNLDIAAAHHQGEDISVLWGDGDGTFGPAQNIVVGESPVSVAIGDFNGDGNLDLAVAIPISDDVSILMGNGDGTFQAPQNFAAGDSPRSLRIGDLNGDGNLDLALANTTNDDVFSVLLGNGDGSFQAQLSFAIPSGSVGSLSVAVGDLDRDGSYDVAVVPFGKDIVLVFINASVTNDSDGDNIPDQMEGQIGRQGVQVASGEITEARQPLPEGNIEINVKDDTLGQEFTFTLPPGTRTTGPGDAIVLEVFPDAEQPRVEVQNALLPPGTTKAVTLPWPDPAVADRIIIVDQAGATVVDLTATDGSNVIPIPPTGQSSNANVFGQPTAWTVTNNGDGTVTVGGLEHTALGITYLPVEIPPLEVAIDVKPWRYRNIIRLDEDDECEDNGKLHVALLGSRDLDVRSVEVSTLALGDPDLQGTAQPIRSRVRRVNRDRYKDLLLVFSLCDLTDGALQGSTEQVDLTGQTKDVIPIQGSDSVRVVTDDDEDEKWQRWRWSRWWRWWRR